MIMNMMKDGKKVAILNKKETMIAQQKQDAIKEALRIGYGKTMIVENN